MRVLLVSPKWAGHGHRKKIKVREDDVHPLTLGILAALSAGHQVRIVDEHVEPVPFDEPWDLVGITATTYRAPRAYAIADRFRARRVPVVLGGIHPTLLPEEGLGHADAVVRGEAESVWAEVLAAAARRQLGGVYQGGCVTDLARVPVPRRDLYRRPAHRAAWVQATRGCGLGCKFCYLQYTGWGAFRQRPVARVIEEIRQLRGRVVLFVDDNLFVDRDYALGLFRELAPLGKFWWAQAPTTACLDEELLDAAYRSGCFALSVGLQTVNQASMEQAQVMQNRIERYDEVVRNLHRHHILVDATFIFGFDADPPSIFRDTVEATRELALDSTTFYTLTPYPGTPYFAELEAEGRIVDRNWGHYDWDHAVIRPARMSPGELEAGIAWAYRTIDATALGWMARNAVRNLWVVGRSPELAWFLLRQNYPERYLLDY